MEIIYQPEGRNEEVISLFTRSFTDSEGENEGQIIGSLVRHILTGSKRDDTHVFCAGDNGTMAGAIIFTPLDYSQDRRKVLLLSPVAVATDRQGEGIGQKLISHALQKLAGEGVDIVLTYGDINFYSKTGFRQISMDEAQPPYALQYPEGWLGQGLQNQGFKPLVGPSRCVEAFRNPAIW